MNITEIEEEIKVEYFDTFEVDPLSEKSLKRISKDTFDSLSTKIVSNEIIFEKAVTEGPISNQVLVNDENNDPDPIEPDIETKWYKLVNNIGRYVCLFCNLSYSTVQTLRNHVKVKHVHKYYELKNSMISCIRRQKLKCHVCKKAFKNTIDLKEHINKHGMTNILKSCCVCHATFEETLDMLNHMSQEHKSLKKKLHFCSICGYSTSKLSHFKQHENTHTRHNTKKCSHCDYSTNYLPNLKIHERTHTNNKPYVCSYEDCGYRCAAKSALYSHQLKHDKEKNMLYCDQCSYSTVYKNSLKKHTDSHKRNSLRKKF